MTRGVFDQPEALVFRDRLIGMDCPVEVFAARLVADLDRLDRYGARGDIARPRPRDPA